MGSKHGSLEDKIAACADYLEAILAQLGTLNVSEGTGPMRLVKFIDGTKDIWVNPAEVSALEEAGATRTKIHLQSGTTFTVDMIHTDAAAALASDTQ